MQNVQTETCKNKRCWVHVLLLAAFDSKKRFRNEFHLAKKEKSRRVKYVNKWCLSVWLDHNFGQVPCASNFYKLVMDFNAM